MTNNVMKYGEFWARRTEQLRDQTEKIDLDHAGEVINFIAVRNRKVLYAQVTGNRVSSSRHAAPALSYPQQTLRPSKVLHYRVQFDGFDETVTDPVEVHKLTRDHPEAIVQVIKVTG